MHLISLAISPSLVDSVLKTVVKRDLPPRRDGSRRNGSRQDGSRKNGSR